MLLWDLLRWTFFLTTLSRVMIVGPTNSVVYYRHSTCFWTTALGLALKVKLCNKLRKGLSITTETGAEFQNKQRYMKWRRWLSVRAWPIASLRPMDNEYNNGSENVAKKWICVLSNFIALFWTRLICQMKAIFLGCWSWIVKGLYPGSKKEKGIFVVVGSRGSHQEVLRRSRKFIIKSVMHVQLNIDVVVVAVVVVA